MHIDERCRPELAGLIGAAQQMQDFSLDARHGGAMANLRRCGLGFVAALMAATPTLAHHEWPVDRTRQITVTGTVTAYTWKDPHVMITLNVQANGTIEKWNVGGTSRKYMAVNGWDKNTLRPGDVITGIGYRFRDGSNAAQLQKIVMASGKEMDVYGRLGVLPAAVSAPRAENGVRR
jgi:hypothetical protein